MSSSGVTPLEAAASAIWSRFHLRGWETTVDVERQNAINDARATLRAAIEALPEQDAVGCLTIVAPVFVRPNVTTDGTVLVPKSLLFRAFGLEEETE